MIAFFARHPSQETTFSRLIAPALAAILLTGIAILAVQHYATLLGVAPGSTAAWALPIAYGAAAALGLIWGVILKISRPDIYKTIGLGAHAISVQADSDLGGRS